MSINWKKPLIILLDIALAAYLVMAITAFNKPDESNDVCNDIKIQFNESIVEGFLCEEEIKNILKHNGIYPLAQQMSNIDIRKIEETIEKNPYIENVECYKTQGGSVVINLSQKMPVIRIMAENGDNYYVDSKGSILAANKYTSNMIIATGNISKRFAQNQLREFANYILHDKFWHNQIVQLNILSGNEIEIVPRVGEHIVYLGKPIGYEHKLKRLEQFYKYGLSQAGWNRYSYINIEFDNQIICRKKQNKKTI